MVHLFSCKFSFLFKCWFSKFYFRIVFRCSVTFYLISFRLWKNLPLGARKRKLAGAKFELHWMLIDLADLSITKKIVQRILLIYSLSQYECNGYTVVWVTREIVRTQVLNNVQLPSYTNAAESALGIFNWLMNF